MSVHYKFKSALESDTVSFDGLHISVRDLKNSIMQQKRIGRNNDFDLQVTNAETKEVYDNEDALIPKNTSLLIARVPSLQSKPKVWEGYGDSSSPISKSDDLGPIAKAMDLATLDASEEDKIKAMMSQSTVDYDPSNYVKIRGANQVGTVPPNYRCYRCHQGGHWIKDCVLNQATEAVEIKKSTGIPRSFMVTVEGPQVQGAMITPNGSFAVPALDHQAYTEKPHPAPLPQENKAEIPEDLVCSICSDLLTDAVMIPCCGDSYCDECIRSCLLESEEHECPACHEKDISPGTLIPNRYLRNSVTNFKSTTGYVKRPVYKPLPIIAVQPTQAVTIPVEATSSKETQEEVKLSIEPSATSETNENKSSASAVEIQKSIPDSNPAASKESTNKEDQKTSRNNIESFQRKSPRDEHSSGTVRIITGVGAMRPKLGPNERSPRRRYHKSSPSYQHRNERGGTPTVDEPGIVPSTSVDTISAYQPPTSLYPAAMPPSNMGMMVIPPPSIQPPVTNYGQVPVYPPPSGIMTPNFRLPPPGAAPYVPGGYPPRPMYDMGRVPNYPPVYPSGSRGSKSRDYHRDYPSRRGRSPLPTIIDDPLEAFNRMLREKDERERRAKQRKTARSYSRSSSRSPSPSPPPIRKIHVSRSPRRRSRSRSFSISRSRSRSFSPGPRISPPARNFSPKRPHRKMHGRFQSPTGRSPQRFRFNKEDDRDHRPDRGRDNHGFDREGDQRDFRGREPRDRDFKYYDGGYERNRGRGRQHWNGPRNPPEQYYQAPEMPVQQPYMPTNRYQSHDAYPPPLIQPSQHQPPQQHQPPSQIQIAAQSVRKYEDDVMPPGTDQPPVPGLENAPSIEERYQYTAPKKEPELIKQEEEGLSNLSVQNDAHSYDAMGGTPEKKYYSPPPRKQERDREYQATPEKHHKRRKHDDVVERRKERDASDDDRSSRKNKEKKRKKEKREKKEEERKKRRERREKREQEKLHKKTMEEKEKYERKHKRDVVKHDAETQASNEEDEGNGEVDMYDDQINRYNSHEELEHKNEEFTNIEHYEDATLRDEIEHDEIIIEEVQEAENVGIYNESPKSDIVLSPAEEPPNAELYGDLLTEEIDNSVMENYGKMKSSESVPNVSETVIEQLQDEDSKDEGEITDDDDDDDDQESEKDILELHTNEAELKMEAKSEVLAPLPERSKWEVDEDISIISSSSLALLRGDSKLERTDKFGKVTNEVLKRAENAIFAKAINAIRPIEIKKISMDRAKLYSGERDKDKSGDELREEARNIHITITGGVGYDNSIITVEPDKSPPKQRLSVKERLGCKVDELDRIVKIDKPYERNRSHSLSPLSRRSDLMSRNLGQGERRLDLENRNRSNNRINNRDRNRDFHQRQFRNDNRRDIRNNNRNRRDLRLDRDRRKDDSRRDNKKGVNSIDKKSRDKGKPPFSKSSSDEKERNKRKDRKDKKKERVKRHKKESESEGNKQVSTKPFKNDDEKNQKLPSTTDKRKPTLDEASFEPDYDLESESEKEDAVKKDKGEKTKHVTKSPEQDLSKKRPKIESKKYDSSSSDSTESSSEDDRKRRKHRKHKKRKHRRDSSSSSSSESESESSNDNHEKHRKRHKKKLKKKKKSKHK